MAAAAAGVSTVKTLSQAVGAVGGGFLLEVTSPATVFAAAAALLLIGGGDVALRPRADPRRMGPRPSRIRDRMRGMFDVVLEPHVGGLLVVSGLRTFVRGMWIALAVIAALRLLHGGRRGSAS